MEQRKLGAQGLVVSALGLGCMQMSGYCGRRLAQAKCAAFAERKLRPQSGDR